MKNRIFLVIIAIIVVIAGISFFISSQADKRIEGESSSAKEEILYWTCGMHPSVRSDNPGMCPICNMALVPVYKEGADEEVEEGAYYGCGMIDGTCPSCDDKDEERGCSCGGHTFTIEGIKQNCPMCGGPLRKLSKEETDKMQGVVSRVKIKKEQLVLAGVETQSVKKQHVFKEIRTAGKVAYDPGLAIAQEEYLSTLKSRKKLESGLIEEIKERSDRLLESSKRKLMLLGMSDEQIKDLEQQGQIQGSLILPESKMWIYGDVYEYELSWIRQGEEVVVTTQSYPGEEFRGEVVSVNPVVDSRKRTIRFRAQVDNPGLKLKPEMYVDIVIESMYLDAFGSMNVLAIPKEAVLDTGKRKIVWLDKGQGNYEGRVIKVGPVGVSLVDGKRLKFYPVLSGLKKGELVVTKGNFLIDSQSQLTGVAASSYGGALGTKDEQTPTAAVHQH